MQTYEPSLYTKKKKNSQAMHLNHTNAFEFEFTKTVLLIFIMHVTLSMKIPTYEHCWLYTYSYWKPTKVLCIRIVNYLNKNKKQNAELCKKAERKCGGSWKEHHYDKGKWMPMCHPVQKKRVITEIRRKHTERRVAHHTSTVVHFRVKNWQGIHAVLCTLRNSCCFLL